MLTHDSNDDLNAQDRVEPDSVVEAVATEMVLASLRSRFVGRVDQLKRLKQFFVDCQDKRELTFVTVVGEPGSGKTRLIREFARSVRAAVPDGRVLWGDALDPSAPSYESIAGAFFERFGISRADDYETAFDKIYRGVSEIVPERQRDETAHLLAYLMNIPLPDSDVLNAISQAPGQIELRAYIAARRFLREDSKSGPMLLCFDQIERASSETVNLLHYLAEGLRDSAVTIVAVGRPTLFRKHPRWGQGEFTRHRINLGPMPPDDASQLLGELVHVPNAPDSLLHVARDCLRGNPRAIFEFARYLIETNVVTPDGDGPWPLDRERLASVSLPRTHEDILRARLHALPRRERDLLEKAAAVGEVFWLDAVIALRRSAELSVDDPDGPSLEAIAERGDHSQNQASRLIDGLLRRGLVVQAAHSSIAGETEYAFAYPPIWDLAYELLNDDARRRYHRLIAQWLELRPEGRLQHRQEQVGHHLQRAGDSRGAATRYRRAADAARSQYFNHKAIRLYHRALGCLGETDLGTRLHIWHDLGSVYQLTGNFDRALDAFERMVRLGWVVASRPKAAVAFNKMGRVWRAKGSLDLSREYLHRGMTMFEEAGDDRGVATSLDDLGQVHYLEGDYGQALHYAASALEMRRRLGDKRSIAVSLTNIGNIERDRGLLAEAEACFREAVKLRSEVGDRRGRLVSLCNLGQLEFERGNKQDARQHWEQALSEAESIGAVPDEVTVLGRLGELALKNGKVADARQRLERARNLAIEIDDRRAVIDLTRNAGLLELAEGNREDARDLLAQTIELAKSANVPELIGRAEMALGEFHASTLFDASATDEASPADEHFERAIAIFSGLGTGITLAQALQRYGEYQVEHGRLEDGRATLEQALAILRNLGIERAAALERMIARLR